MGVGKWSREEAEKGEDRNGNHFSVCHVPCFVCVQDVGFALISLVVRDVGFARVCVKAVRVFV